MSGIQEVEAQRTSPATVEEYRHAVHIAIKADSLNDVQSLLQQWRSVVSVPDPNSQDLQYLVPEAAKKDGKPAILEYLLSQGGKIDTYTKSHTTSPEIFQIFVKHGWKVDNTMLYSHIAHPDLISLFLAYGADPKDPTTSGTTPLDVAALRGPLESVKLLHSHGAPVGPGSWALNAAAQGDVPDRIPVMEYLLEHGADVNGIAGDFTGPSEARRSGRRGTPLHAAANWGNKEAKAWLLEHGADPEAKNELGETPAEWEKRFDHDGPEKIARIRRNILRKNQTKMEESEKQTQEGGQEVA